VHVLLKKKNDRSASERRRHKYTKYIGRWLANPTSMKVSAILLFCFLCVI